MDGSLIDKFLNTLYFKSRDDLKKGYSVSLLSKLLGFDNKTKNNILHYLTDKNLIDTKSGYGDNISLTYQGIDYVNALRKGKIFKIIRFKEARYIPPASRIMYGFLFWYDIINEDGRVKNHTIGIFASDVLSMSWQLPFYDRLPDAEKILLQFAKDNIIEKLKEGTLNEQEEIVLMSSTQPTTCPYDPNKLIDTKYAEYEIEVSVNNATENKSKNELPKSTNNKIEMKSNPKIFISYAWESVEIKEWVKQLAIKLRNIGIDAKLDQWEVVPGDRMPLFMEKSVRENDYVLIICSPKYKEKSENRIGGVGYEGDIMTAEVLQNSNHRKFIPILQSGTKETSIPSWLQGKYYIDLSNDYHFDKNFDDLITTIFNARESAPELGPIPSKFQNQSINLSDIKVEQEEKIRIKGILVDEVTEPLSDGTKGSALYKIPFELSREPDNEWIELFINAWNRPPHVTQMHRPGIASVYGNKIILDGTTIEEVERYHKRTLKLAVEVANNSYDENQARIKQIEEQEKKRKEEHKKNIDDISKRINFD